MALLKNKLYITAMDNSHENKPDSVSCFFRKRKNPG